MNKWHSLHKYFRNLANDEQRIMLAINGLDAKVSIIILTLWKGLVHI